MNHILSRQNRAVLEQLAWANSLLAFDYDGTLAPIVPDPERAIMRPATRALLAELARLYPCVVISGRSQDDARRRLRGVPLREVIGNHGVEPWRASRALIAEVGRWRRMLERRLAAERGVTIEDKGYSLALHYRRSRAKKRARAAILAAAAAIPNVRIVGGKLVVNLVARDAPHKGIALQRERERLGCDTAAYVGDDETDEDVFALDQPGRLLTIRVGHKHASLAAYSLRDQREIDVLLRELVRLRKGRGGLERRSA